ncbi:MAG: TolC family protein [Gemmatimonadaceae bacterium]|nr:TolC family protein [Gemmatimonadaceae bacterium]
MIRAQVTRDNQRPGWLQSRTNRDLAYLRLRQLLNVADDRPLALTDSIVETAAPAANAPTAPITTVNVPPADVLTMNPAVQARVAQTIAAGDTSALRRAPVRQALKGVEVAQQQLKATKSQRLPSLAATTNYQRLAYPIGVLPKSLADFFPNWTVGIGLSYPLFTGGRIRGDILAAEASVIEAQERLKQAQEGASLDARSSAARLLEAEATWQASVGTAEQAQRAYAIAEVRFREGISTQLELSETRVQLQQALANRARAARDLQVARKRIELLRDLPLSSASPTSTGFTQ